MPARPKYNVVFEPGFFTAEIAEIAEPDTMSPFFGQAGKKRSDSEDLLFLDPQRICRLLLRPPRALR
jgi:hypothetical protein